jgi:general secretion pathway protein F
MPVFEYKALNLEGRSVRGVLDADSAKAVREKLRSQDVFVTEIDEVDQERVSGTRGVRLPRILRARKASEIALLTRQLATLLGAGLTISDSLSALIDQIKDRRLEAGFRDIREKIVQGASFGEALEQHPLYFTDLYVNMVKAGEASGNLDDILSQLADFLQKQNRLQSKIVASLTYPAVLIGVGVLVIFVLMKFAVPKILMVLETGKRTLPLPTKILISSSSFFEKYWLVLLIGIAILYILYRLFIRTDRGKLWRDTVLLRLPVVGEMFRKQAVARFAMTFAILLRSGISVLEGLEIVSKVVNNRLLSQTLEALRKRIMEGTDIATPLKRSGVFPPAVGYMIAIGEESGQLEDILDKITEAYEDEVEISTQKMMSLLEPAIILALGGIVAFIAGSIIWPILEMSKIR